MNSYRGLKRSLPSVDLPVMAMKSTCSRKIATSARDEAQKLSDYDEISSLSDAYNCLLSVDIFENLSTWPRDSQALKRPRRNVLRRKYDSDDNKKENISHADLHKRDNDPYIPSFPTMCQPATNALEEALMKSSSHLNEERDFLYPNKEWFVNWLKIGDDTKL